jgi:3-isopropylmalate/(R)-2-methylmalate dehydratase small subunit
VISTSFADIFRNNALKNGLLTVIVTPDVHGRIFELSAERNDLQVTIDLPSQILSLPDDSKYTIPIDPFSKTCLIEGVDQMGYLLQRVPLIAEYEQVNGL